MSAEVSGHLSRLAAGIKLILMLLAAGAVIASPIIGLSWLGDKYDEWLDRPKPPPPSAQPYHQSYEEAMEEQAYQYEQQEEEEASSPGTFERRSKEHRQQQGGGDFEDRCEYDPTMNYDWHDDWVCDGERLYLLPDDEFVDQQELEQAARRWIS